LGAVLTIDYQHGPLVSVGKAILLSDIEFVIASSGLAGDREIIATEEEILRKIFHAGMCVPARGALMLSGETNG
jgi:hypothetical protein